MILKQGSIVHCRWLVDGRGALHRATPSNKRGTSKTVRAKFRPWLSGKSDENFSRCSLFGGKHGMGAHVNTDTSHLKRTIYPCFRTTICPENHKLDVKLSGEILEPGVNSSLEVSGGREGGAAPPSAVQRKWHIQDSQGQIPALAFRSNSLKSASCSLSGGKHGRGAQSCTERYSSQFKNNCLAEMWSGAEEGLVFKAHRLLHHSTLGARVITKTGGGRTWTAAS